MSGDEWVPNNSVCTNTSTVQVSFVLSNTGISSEFCLPKCWVHKMLAFGLNTKSEHSSGIMSAEFSSVIGSQSAHVRERKFISSSP